MVIGIMFKKQKIEGLSKIVNLSQFVEICASNLQTPYLEANLLHIHKLNGFFSSYLGNSY